MNNFFVKCKYVVDFGLFDEGIVWYGFEDYDFGIRFYQVGLMFRLYCDIVSVYQEYLSNCKFVDDIWVNIVYMCDKYNNICFLDVYFVFNGLFFFDMMNGIMVDIYKFLEFQKYDMLLNLFFELFYVVKECNIDLDW